MPVSSVVVTCTQGKAEAVIDEIAAVKGLEVHGVLADGQVVVVIEADTVQEEVDIVARLHEVDDVITVRMAYHNFEDIETV